MMKGFNLLCAGVVLLCAVVLSYHHSVELMARGGYHGVYRHIAVVMAELTFLAGAANVVRARFQKRSPGVAPVIGALFGVALTGWANISAGLEYGWTGVLLGAMVPMALVISESILAHFLLKDTEDTRNETTNDEATTKEDATTNTKTARVATTTDDTDTSEESTSESDAATTTNENTIRKTGDTGNAGYTGARKTGGRKVPVDIEVERAKKVALRIKEEEGKLPGRPRLKDEAGVKENVARRALAELKQELAS